MVTNTKFEAALYKAGYTSRKELCDDIGIHRVTLTRLLKDPTKGSVSTVTKIVKALDLKPTEINEIFFPQFL